MTIMRSEITEQPDRLEELIHLERRSVEAIAERLRGLDIHYLVLVARGSSDNAARYGKYLFGARLGLQTALATPSLFTLYQQPPSLNHALVIGISQSGQSDDIVSVLREARRQSSPTLAITNAPGSPLADQADEVIPLHVGEERSLAATKSYSGQLTALAMLAAAWRQSVQDWDQLSRIPDLVHRTIALDNQLQTAVERYVEAERCVVLGRGYNYSTAFEIALKLKEICYLPAEAYSPADFLHGPIALLDPGYPAILVAPSGTTYQPLLDFSRQLREKGASILTITDQAKALEAADLPLKLAQPSPEWLSPIPAVVPGQLFTLCLAEARGLDPDQPRGLSKVTITR
jgi:glucosamine--fructose-6-phosphate aminotransferase (isomerizing)